MSLGEEGWASSPFASACACSRCSMLGSCMEGSFVWVSGLRRCICRIPQIAGWRLPWSCGVSHALFFLNRYCSEGKSSKRSVLQRVAVIVAQDPGLSTGAQPGGMSVVNGDFLIEDVADGIPGPKGKGKQRVHEGDKGGSRLYLRCLLYTSPSPRDKRQSRMPSSA